MRLEAESVRTPAVEEHWRGVIRQLGAQCKRLRQLAGLSQDQLARSARLSQGAVSRVESGGCTATPLVTYGKLATTLDRELSHHAPDVLHPDLAGFLATVRAFDALPEAPLVSSPMLARLLEAYRRFDPADQPTFVVMVEALAIFLEQAQAHVEARRAGPQDA